MKMWSALSANKLAVNVIKVSSSNDLSSLSPPSSPERAEQSPSKGNGNAESETEENYLPSCACAECDQTVDRDQETASISREGDRISQDGRFEGE